MKFKIYGDDKQTRGPVERSSFSAAMADAERRIQAGSNLVVCGTESPFERIMKSRSTPVQPVADSHPSEADEAWLERVRHPKTTPHNPTAFTYTWKEEK